MSAPPQEPHPRHHPPEKESQQPPLGERWRDPISLDRPRWILDNADFRAIRDAWFELTGVDLDLYRTQQLERRLSTWLERKGLASGHAFACRLREQPEELQQFAQFLTINVSSFYRDASRWAALEQIVLPELLHQAAPNGLRVWSAGCSIGAEPFTVAMLLLDQAPETPHRIRATDIDRWVLARAREGGPYTAAEIRELPPRLARRFLDAEPGSERFWVKPPVRRLVHFEQNDLLRERFPTGYYDLILCRNVVIYFTPAVRAQIFAQLSRALRPGGVLFVGGTETFSHYWDLGLEYVAPSLYRLKSPIPA